LHYRYELLGRKLSVLVLVLVTIIVISGDASALVPPPPGIFIKVSPEEPLVGAGCPAVLNIKIYSDGYDGWSNLTMINLPEGVSAEIYPSFVNTTTLYASGHSTLTDLILTLMALPMTEETPDGYNDWGGDFYYPHEVPLYVISCDQLGNVIRTTTEIRTIAIRQIFKTTTITDTVTSTLTLETETDGATEPLTYAWAIGATITAAILAAFIILKKRT
jgi:hypothetical protein